MVISAACHAVPGDEDAALLPLMCGEVDEGAYGQLIDDENGAISMQCFLATRSRHW